MVQAQRCVPLIGAAVTPPPHRAAGVHQDSLKMVEDRPYPSTMFPQQQWPYGLGLPSSWARRSPPLPPCFRALGRLSRTVTVIASCSVPVILILKTGGSCHA